MNRPRQEQIESQENLSAFLAEHVTIVHVGDGKCPAPKGWDKVETMGWMPSPDVMDEINLQEIAKEEGKGQFINDDHKDYDDLEQGINRPHEDYDFESEDDLYGGDTEIDERDWD